MEEFACSAKNGEDPVGCLAWVGSVGQDQEWWVDWGWLSGDISNKWAALDNTVLSALCQSEEQAPASSGAVRLKSRFRLFQLWDSIVCFEAELMPHEMGQTTDISPAPGKTQCLLYLLCFMFPWRNCYLFLAFSEISDKMFLITCF